MSEWETEEMEYWEGKYSYKGPLFHPSYRVFEREKFLFRWLRGGIKDKALMEIGCSFPHTIILLLDPSIYQYDYIGVDVARHALRAARKHVPEGMFDRCSVISLPFKEQSFDIILSLGVIHHLPGGTDNIHYLSKYLKTNGLFALTEGVERKTLKSTLGRLRCESDSPHESRLDSSTLIEACQKSGKILHFHKSNSIVLGLFSVLIDFFPILQESKTYLRFITAIDQVAIRTLGRIWSLFDAGAYFLILRKT